MTTYPLSSYMFFQNVISFCKDTLPAITTFFMVGAPGLEPGTAKVYHDIISSFGEIANASPPSWTRIVPAEVYFVKFQRSDGKHVWAHQDLNLEPRRYKLRALTIELYAHIFSPPHLSL
jgi:hypothetical protein